MRRSTARKIIQEEYDRIYPGLGEAMPIRFRWAWRWAARTVRYEYPDGHELIEIDFNNTSVWNASRKDILHLANHELAHALVFVSKVNEPEHGPFWQKQIQELGYAPKVKSPTLLGEKISIGVCWSINLAFLVYGLMR